MAAEIACRREVGVIYLSCCFRVWSSVPWFCKQGANKHGEKKKQECLASLCLLWLWFIVWKSPLSQLAEAAKLNKVFLLTASYTATLLSTELLNNDSKHSQVYRLLFYFVKFIVMSRVLLLPVFVLFSFLVIGLIGFTCPWLASCVFKPPLIVSVSVFVPSVCARFVPLVPPAFHAPFFNLYFHFWMFCISLVQGFSLCLFFFFFFFKSIF